MIKNGKDPDLAKKLHTYVGHVSGSGLFTRFLIILLVTGGILGYFYYQATENEVSKFLSFNIQEYNPNYTQAEQSKTDENDELFGMLDLKESKEETK